MTGKDEERLEDYLELERYIQELQAGHCARPSPSFALHQTHIYLMVALFRAASAEEAEPRPEFSRALWERLEHSLQQPPAQGFSFLHKESFKKFLHPPRRALLTRGVAVVVSLVIGAGVEWIAEQRGNHERLNRIGSTDTGTDATTAPLLKGASTAWHYVTTLALLDDEAQRFTTDSIVGYVLRDDGDNGDVKEKQIIALSAACTHMGCLVRWHAPDRTFHCPCHGGLFTENGLVDKRSNLFGHLSPLPRLETKVEGGKVYVRVPVSQR